MNRKIKILFVGQIESSHAQSWINMLDETRFEVICFATTRQPVPLSFSKLIYSTGRGKWSERHLRRGLPKGGTKLLSALSLALNFNLHDSFAQWWLARLVKRFKPDIIHCLGASYGGMFFLQAYRKYGLQSCGKWVIQARGGPDLFDGVLDPAVKPSLQEMLQTCDLFIADNHVGYDIARQLGCPEQRLCHGIMPGTGGLDLAEAASNGVRDRLPSQRERVILWPKAYEGFQSKGLPVLEAICRVWDRIQPCRVILTATNDELVRAVKRLPAHVQAHLEVLPRISRQDLLGRLVGSRVVLAPSLSDGVPNVLYEAMAYGAAPIVSPLETITRVVSAPRNVIFARNLDICEIEQALIAAMTDDVLVDSMARANFEDVAVLADRRIIGERLAAEYQSLVGIPPAIHGQKG